MNAVVDRAITLWGFDGASYELVAARENAVFKVTTERGAIALRLHRKGYRSDIEIQSELDWMAALGQGGISIPAPIASQSGKFLHLVDGIQVDVLEWLSGAPMGETGTALHVPDRAGLFRQIGSNMALMHTITDGWTPPRGFLRCDWNRPALLGEEPVWGRFWENPSLSLADKHLFSDFRSSADAALKSLEGTSDYGLIHADLVRENILLDGDHIAFIDFDDAGFGFRLFDIATALLKNMDEPDYPMLRAALIDGYIAHRPIDLTALDLFIVLRATTYVGWIINKMAEDGAQARNSRFIKTARHLVLTYLAHDIALQ